MGIQLSAQGKRIRARLRATLLGPQSLAFLPAIALAAYWLGGEPVLVATALGLPLLFYLGGAFSTDAGLRPDRNPDVVAITDLPDHADPLLTVARAAQLTTACFMLDVDGLEAVDRRWGHENADALRDLTLSRLRNILRRGDVAYRVGESRFAVMLEPAPQLDLESLLQLAGRLQTGLEEPAQLEKATHYLSVSVGFCSSARLPAAAGGGELVGAAETALCEALANGPSAVRAWSDSMVAAITARDGLLAEVSRAMVSGQIQPWFQPQVCTSTGRISGVEALARWIHPERGIVPPMQFLRCLEEAGQMDRLGEVVLQHSLTALRSWDQAGIDIPRVSVNFSGVELRNPQLVERIKWELDRFGLTPQRLGIEVLETVIADSPEGIVARNIVDLGKLGCHIDLDDFGTGHASITALRRFTVHRLKIDRSFVTRVDRDEEQRRMLAAVLSLADRLALETLAEGVESVGEHALLAQLGCDHVQGFGIARPMAADQMVDWSRAHSVRIADAQWLGRSTG